MRACGLENDGRESVEALQEEQLVVVERISVCFGIGGE